MASEATITEISKTDLPMSLMSGSAEKRRALICIRATSAATTDTVTLATYIPGVADIEGVAWNSMNSAVSSTAVTWSTTTLTIASHAGSGVAEIGLIVNFT